MKTSYSKKFVIEGLESGGETPTDFVKLYEDYEELEVAKKIAEEENSAKSKFLADMCHEIRTPMNVVVGVSRLLLDTELNEAQRRYVEVLRSSSEALLNLVNGILDFSKIEEGCLEIEKATFDLMERIEVGVDGLAIQAEQKELELIFVPDFSLPRLVEGDASRLLQVINNLTGNAIKFTEKGKVIVRVSGEREEDGDLVCRFSIHDTGIGISEEKQKILFQRFSQTDISITRNFGGSGLGLAISKQLVQRMGGEIGLVSKEGEGAEFWFTVRFGVPAENPSFVQLPILAGKRALVIDAREEYCEALKAHLLDWKMEVHIVDSFYAFSQAIRKARSEGGPYEVAFIDMEISMQTSSFTENQLWNHLDCLGVLSVNVRPFGQFCTELCEKKGFSACIGKPLRHSELRDMLYRLLVAENVEKDREEKVAFEKLGLHALLVEDYPANQMLAQVLLEKMGVTCDLAKNGRDAVEALQTVQYDLVLMDIQMPVMDGLDATRKIREKYRGQPIGKVPIIAMTAQALTQDRERCLAAGMDDYISKPIDDVTLFSVLKKWVLGTGRQPKMGLGDHGVEDEKASMEVGSDGVTKIYDRRGLLMSLGGNPQFAVRFLEKFFQNASEDIRNAQGYLESGDYEKIHRISHNLKGTCGYFHSPSYKSVVEAFDAALKSQSVEHLIPLFLRMKQEYEVIRQAVICDFFGDSR